MVFSVEDCVIIIGFIIIFLSIACVIANTIISMVTGLVNLINKINDRE